ncbi:hypothetical protein C8R46DRAFT_1028399 [Mycena filopes]|nr:hypothetical protein C8R46DRAFT_1028399 [Mycena filopes]
MSIHIIPCVGVGEAESVGVCRSRKRMVATHLWQCSMTGIHSMELYGPCFSFSEAANQGMGTDDSGVQVSNLSATLKKMQFYQRVSSVCQERRMLSPGRPKFKPGGLGRSISLLDRENCHFQPWIQESSGISGMLNSNFQILDFSNAYGVLDSVEGGTEIKTKHYSREDTAEPKPKKTEYIRSGGFPAATGYNSAGAGAGSLAALKIQR